MMNPATSSSNAKAYSNVPASSQQRKNNKCKVSDSSIIKKEKKPHILKQCAVCNIHDDDDGGAPRRSQSQRSSSSGSNKIFTFLVWIAVLLYVGNLTINNNKHNNHISGGDSSVYVPGAGFSGFWFTLGRLHSIKDPTSKNYYCFSAGCMGVVASLRNYTVDDLLDSATNAQQRWKTGQIDRFQVVTEFVDDLLLDNDNILNNNATTTATRETERRRIALDDDMYSRINVITANVGVWPFGIKNRIRQPTNNEELREMLIQTAWIPFATGNGLVHKSSKSGTKNGDTDEYEYHIDGGFSILLGHPKCTHVLSLPLVMVDLFLNSLNVNLSKEKVKEFYQTGLSYGL